MVKSILVLNGPTLNMLGTRESEIYGSQTLAEIEAMCVEHGRSYGISVEFRQSNHEGELVDWILDARGKFDAIIINPAAYSHTSVALHDALRAAELPLVEVHLSNIHQRETFRHHSYVSSVANGVICGLGPTGYKLAITALAE